MRILDDPHAEGFLTRRGRTALASLRGIGAGAELIDRGLSGVATYALARHACLDAWLRDGLSAGAVGQVVLLGAGYDSRAWRLADALDGRWLYEVDHPATSARKAARVEAMGLPEVPRRVVAVDLASTPFAPALAGAGWRPELPTAWVWEGVSMYLDPAAVAATLAAIRAASAPGSELLMDFWGMPPGTHPRAVMTRLVAGTFAAFGEPVRGSFPPEAGRAALREAGMEPAEVLDAAGLRARHVPDGRTVLPDAWLVRARCADGPSDPGSASN